MTRLLHVVHSQRIQNAMGCHLPFALSNSADTYNYEAILVSYDGYYDRNIRLQFLSQILSQVVFNVEPRPNVFSDFDVLELTVQNFNSTDIHYVYNALRHSKRVRNISQNRRFYGKFPRQPLLLRSRRSDKKIRYVADQLNASRLWHLGFKGQGVKIGIFDTGLSSTQYFQNIVERTDWTDEGTTDDGHGHGTFVAGIIASSRPRCLGLAPAASIFIYKVFTSAQLSTTSWFLDAFNHAVLRGVNVINLSIGGPDYTDFLFVQKVWEVTSNGIIMISAIGNDGPKFGTLNNPGDQMDVIGVGGIDFYSKIADFSSRGMTTWELPGGYGRLKPDIVTYGVNVYGLGLSGECKPISGTSVASPIVAGAVTLMLSGIKDHRFWNPATVKQVLIDGADRLDKETTMFEQGAGRLNLLRSFELLRHYKPTLKLFPSYIDFTECNYMWPYCIQPIYHTGLPTIVNPVWEPFIEENGDLLNISIGYSDLIYPWSGYMSLAISVCEDGKNFEGTAGGRIIVKITSTVNNTDVSLVTKFLLRVKIVPTPPRRRRVIWDQYRSIRYPPGYIPFDNLEDIMNPLDWTADHPHTTFTTLYYRLRKHGYFLEVLGQPLTCVNLSNYAAYVIVDPEEDFFPNERLELFRSIDEEGLNLIIFADWYNWTIIQKFRHLDRVTKRWWQPETGGSNIIALNQLLALWDISLGTRVFDGLFYFGEDIIKYSSGASIIEAPPEALILPANLTDIGEEVLFSGRKGSMIEVIVFALLYPTGFYGSSGFVAVFGDSNCLEDIQPVGSHHCLKMSSYKPVLPSEGNVVKKYDSVSTFANYSKVIDVFDEDGYPLYSLNSKCIDYVEADTFPIYNSVLPKKLWSVMTPHQQNYALYDESNLTAQDRMRKALNDLFGKEKAAKLLSESERQITVAN
uniref:Peptidase_S8 domain-containing protein n=1 Tax=Syphacia muris TaxID=451379 RepID=A0A0N5B054_9BILA